MITTASEPSQNTSQDVEQPQARIGLAIVRLTIGAMFVWVFFENLGKHLYTPAGYAGLINYYIAHDRAPSAWKTVMTGNPPPKSSDLVITRDCQYPIKPSSHHHLFIQYLCLVIAHLARQVSSLLPGLS